jgi:luciferase family oxidoreductase group 1
MLAHYSPLKVAETFRVLHALFPGRIDLGIGRAPGSDRRTALALAQGQPQSIERFPQQLADLAAYLHDGLPPGHPFRGVRATPITPGAPELWLLGSSGGSAAYAAALGCAFSFAHFINPQPGVSAEVLRGYREQFQPSPSLPAPQASLAVRALCADTEAEARRLSASFALMRVRFEQGLWGPVPSLEEALAYPYSPIERAKAEAVLAGAAIGAPEQVRADLEAMARAHGVDELVVVTICHDPAARRRSYELLAQAFELEATRLT